MLLPRSLVVWCAWLVGMGSLLTLQGQAPSNASAGGPPGGYLVAIAVSRDAAATLYASPLSGGVFRSADGGASWVEAGNGLPPGDSCDLQVHPADGRIVFAECRDGLYRTRDSGQGWARIAEDAQLPAIAPSSSEILVATLNRSKDLLVSRTGGRRWERHTPTGLGDRSIRQVVICRSNPAVIYGVTHFGRGLFRSVDSGRHWTAVRLGLDSEAEVNHVRNDPRAVDAIYVAAGPYLLRGDCRGASWAVLHEFSEHIAAVMFSGPPRALAIVVGSRGELFRSEDDGARWRGLGWTPEGHAWNMAGSNMTGNAVSSTLYAATFRGLMTTADDGAHWNRVTGDNLGRASVRSVSIDRNALRVSADVGDFISIDRGATWRAVETPAGEPETWAAPSDPAVQYRSGKDGFLKSMDGGQHWTSAARPADRIPLSLAASSSRRISGAAATVR
jgi:photosystem II stability/assembly factor-like uncharacterized protein